MAKKKKRQKKTKKDSSASKPRGRPSKLTTDIIEKARVAIRGGAYIETVGPFVGVKADTFRSWLRQGAEELQSVEDGIRRTARKKFQLHIELSCVVAEALAELEIECSAIMLKAAKGYQTIKEKTVRKYGPEQTDKDGNTHRPLIEETTTKETVLKRDWRAAERLAEKRFAERWGSIDREDAIRQERIRKKDERPIEWSFVDPDVEDPDVDPFDDRF